jgi:hypothetical protein
MNIFQPLLWFAFALMPVTGAVNTGIVDTWTVQTWVNIEEQTRKYAIGHGWKSVESYFNYWKLYGVKPEVWVCIAVSESSLWKHMQGNNIGNVGVHAGWTFPTLDRWIQVIFTKALNWRYLKNKQTVWDLYRNWDCKIDCRAWYASGPHAQWNVLACLTEIYWKKIGPDFKIRQ